LIARTSLAISNDVSISRDGDTFAAYVSTCDLGRSFSFNNTVEVTNRLHTVHVPIYV